MGRSATTLFAHCSDNEPPWREHGPVALKSLSIAEIDDTDTSLQFRFRSQWQVLKRSLEERGQLNPIKVVVGERAFRIVDGHSRVRAIKELRWTHVRALLYGGMTEREAKALAYQANVTRRNLTVAEKANAMQTAIAEGFSREEVAALFGVSTRTVERHLELPEALRMHVDTNIVTMAHARVLKQVLDRVAEPELTNMVEWIRQFSASASDLEKRLKEEGLLDARTRKRTYGRASSDFVRFYGFKVSATSSASDRERAIRFLERALECLRAMSAAAKAKGVSG